MMLRNKALPAGFAILCMLGIAAAFAPSLALFPPDQMNYGERMQGPSIQHPFGTDFFGRDIFSRTLYGTRIAFLVGFLSVSFAVVPGLLLGLLAGYKQNWIDLLIMHIMDGLLSFPALLLAIAVISVLGPGHIQATISIGIIFLPAFTRLIRGQVLAIRYEEYVQAAVALGASDWRIIFKHILPNIMGPLIVQTTVSFANAILIEAGLSFLGLGTQPPLPSWGAMLQEAKSFMELQPWAAILPGLAIAFSVMGFNLFGDGLRDWIDPRFRPRLIK
ncbi:MAG: ABC transporter permease [bacterium]|nr:ABC transporter permease [bacterium]